MYRFLINASGINIQAQLLMFSLDLKKEFLEGGVPPPPKLSPIKMLRLEKGKSVIVPLPNNFVILL